MNLRKEYNKIMDIFNTNKSLGFYDVDMFIEDIWNNRPEFHDDDDIVDYQMVFIMLARDDDIFSHFGYAGIVILLAELLDKIKQEEL